ncbi:hypothetical protein GCM10010170_033520 [Dactylosporangium salmoneum]|uniref:Uncharacterized protein n=2 Tax=Dactylosporangium salmoneum TaxID=53361 RepID=A0ABN3G8T1_9ACTN
MRRIDWGERPIDETTMRYLINPWYLRRHGKSLSYHPKVHVSVSQLSNADQRELHRLSAVYVNAHWILRASPVFEHPGIAACLAGGDTRPVMRLLWSYAYWGLPNLDIADTSVNVPGGMSLAEHIAGRASS